ncbi:MAG: TlpA family protein disulfide reductase [Bacteroidales bacterium]|nr:TlpA family protein disulfide reductase [Bacteroidales bacterium]HOI32742.1 TlpA family protein disulfide reductase [Bacteroidales bacterium]
MPIMLVNILILFNAVFYQPVAENDAKPAIMDFETFQQYLKHENDTVYVINFWATWCAPCVKELPDFEKLNQKYGDKNFKMLLVSLDFRKMYDTRLIPFIEENKLSAEVILLHDPDANAWIDKVDPSWSGAIPATLIYKNSFRLFHEGGYTFDELNTIVEPLIN